MKKLLLILITGILLSGCGGGESHRLNVQSHKYTAKVVETSDCVLCVLMTWGIQAIPVSYYGYSNDSYNDALRNAIKACKPASYKKCTEDKSFRTVKNESAGSFSTTTTTSTSSSSNYASVEDHKDIILSAKLKCKDMGFTEGTENMALCIKDVYLKETTETKIVQGSTISKPKRRIDPSVWDDLLNVSQGLSRGESVTNALGGVSSSTSKVQCFKTGERVSGTNKICSYNCMGSETTTNIASTRICPMSIDLN